MNRKFPPCAVESGFAKHPLGLADFHPLRRGIYPPADCRCPRAKIPGIDPPTPSSASTKATHHRLPAGAKAPAQRMKVRSSGLCRPHTESASADFHALRRGIYPPAGHRQPPAESGFAKHPLGSADFHPLRRGIYPPAGSRSAGVQP